MIIDLDAHQVSMMHFFICMRAKNGETAWGYMRAGCLKILEIVNNWTFPT